MTLPAGPGGVPTAAVVLVVVLVIGVIAGRASGRFLLLPAGIVGTVLVGAAVTWVGLPAGAARPAFVAALLPVALPLLVAFVAGWLCGRASWFTRIVVLVVATLVVAFFPYATVVPLLTV